MIELDFHFHKPTRLKVKVSINRAEVIGISGPSASGKTSVLRSLAGLHSGAQGLISIAGVTYQDKHIFLAPERRKMGFSFQENRLFPHLTVKDNLAFASQFTSRPSVKSERLIADFELASLLNKFPSQLSGGEKQRVSVTRALSGEFRCVLLDEPFSALDKVTRFRMLNRLLKLIRELQVPAFYVSHDLEELSLVADSLLHIENGKTHFHQQALPILNQRLSSTSDDSDASTTLQCEVAAHWQERHLTELVCDEHSLFIDQVNFAVGDKVRCLLPAKEVSVFKGNGVESSMVNHVRGRIRNLKSLNEKRCLISIALGDSLLHSEITHYSRERLALELGEEVSFQFKSCALQAIT